MRDIYENIRRLRDSRDPFPRYPWPNPNDERIKYLTAENNRLRAEIAALRAEQGRHGGEDEAPDVP